MERGRLQRGELILARIAKKHGITVAEILSRRRFPFLVQARMDIAKKLVPLYGERDTATLLNRTRMTVTYYRSKKYTL